MKKIIVIACLIVPMGLFAQQNNTNTQLPSISERQHMITLTLKTSATEKGLYYRYMPFQFKTHEISWDKVDSAYVREYRPVKEYGGWGFRGSFKRGKAINLKGDVGVQLVFKDGKRLLIGTQKPEAFKDYLLALQNHGIIKTRNEVVKKEIRN